VLRLHFAVLWGARATVTAFCWVLSVSSNATPNHLQSPSSRLGSHSHCHAVRRSAAHTSFTHAHAFLLSRSHTHTLYIYSLAVLSAAMLGFYWARGSLRHELGLIRQMRLWDTTSGRRAHRSRRGGPWPHRQTRTTRPIPSFPCSTIVRLAGLGSFLACWQPAVHTPLCHTWRA
jgi:hypothetical protein